MSVNDTQTHTLSSFEVYPASNTSGPFDGLGPRLVSIFSRRCEHQYAYWKTSVDLEIYDLVAWI